MRIDDLDYELPESLIATHPAERRDHARLLRVTEGGAVDHRFDELPSLLPEGALVVVNDTRVIPARLIGRKATTGGRFELLLVQPLDRTSDEAARWLAMAKSSKRIRLGLEVRLADALDATIEAGPDDRGLFTVALRCDEGCTVGEVIEAEGRVPLPPYLGRDDEPLDRERYQTMFARHPGAVAAPTAGLHFTREVLARLEERGCSIATVTLHVGPGTFKPVKVSDLDEHPMHQERFVVDVEAAHAVERARAAGAPVVAVGTTVVRALESAADHARPGLVRSVEEETGLLIQPGYRFRVVDALVTNFHLPRSTLLALVYAFGGAETVADAYRQAIERGYRFYSYGDAMLLPRCVASTDPGRVRS